MPEKKTIERARKDKREGKSPSTQAGEFVREEIEHVRRGKHGARSPKQAVAIGLSKARRAGVELPPPKKGRASAKTRRKAAKETERGAKKRSPASKKRSEATTKALKREPRGTTSKSALSRQSRSAVKKRSASSRSSAAKKASRTKGPAKRVAASKKAARTRAAKRKKG